MQKIKVTVVLRFSEMSVYIFDKDIHLPHYKWHILVHTNNETKAFPDMLKVHCRIKKAAWRSDYWGTLKVREQWKKTNGEAILGLNNIFKVSVIASSYRVSTY